MFEFAGLRFRPLEKEDLKLLHVWENDSELMMYSRSEPLNMATMAQLEERFAEWTKNEKNLLFIVENMGSNEPIGFASIRREVWGNVPGADVGTYIGKKELWEKGFGKKITVALLEMSFMHLGLEHCQAWSVEYNTRAHRALESCGFKKGGVVRNTVYVAGRKWGSFHFDILQEEYMNIRMNLLKNVLRDEVDGYLEKTGPNLKPAR
ncbi:GNAT family N-acetyltransferase [Candidatus Bathyarchaeota archaeon]|jgi:RimJ/RimL family protein N-acetyltransferase|nr:GNAT family N-acetyltransferase [Candidatus Bathyarchaeota archaeon]